MLQLTAGGQLEVEVLESLLCQLSRARASLPATASDSSIARPGADARGSSNEGPQPSDDSEPLQSSRSDAQPLQGSQSDAQPLQGGQSDAQPHQGSQSDGDDSRSDRIDMSNDGDGEGGSSRLSRPILNQREASQLQVGLAQVPFLTLGSQIGPIRA